MTQWFISDTHFSQDLLGWKNGAGHYIRPFLSIVEMDEIMIQNWNRVVADEDHVWHLGDVGNLDVVKRLRGKKRIIPGNHDQEDWKRYRDAGFQKIASYRVYDNMLFSHIPIHPESLAKFDANVHGHTHQNFMLQYGDVERDYRYVNVSVEAIDYTPISLEQIKQRVGR